MSAWWTISNSFYSYLSPFFILNPLFREAGQRETIVVWERGELVQGGIDASRGLCSVLHWDLPRACCGYRLIDRWLNDCLVTDTRTREPFVAAMDVTLSELLATFMESPLVVWVSGSSTRTHTVVRMMLTHCWPMSLFYFPSSFSLRTNRLSSRNKQLWPLLCQSAVLCSLHININPWIDTAQTVTLQGQGEGLPGEEPQIKWEILVDISGTFQI